MHTFDAINLSVSKYVSFLADELATFNQILGYKKVPKRTFLLKAQEVCNIEAFILKGCVRTYYLDENGAEVILQFAIEGWWVSDIASFHEQTPSKIFIETLEETELLFLNPQSKEELLSKVPKFERVFRLLVQRNLSVTQNRLFKTISKPALEKYLDFLERYPSIPQRVPQHYIASYLGISAEFLSKVRAKLAKK
ncbi:Crp/Fnr family transcriptional regulator [Flectobacillus major]|jgi:CRP-like cAMP-binding protein|uniref:Crp/Fnr family transcriptional regulator n=1 Tax=Flectobacillus major TaxID=103 RepID=UPI0004110748|nr:Crp/Fnr family transcriptional regulator [Flectobacillus major]